MSVWGAAVVIQDLHFIAIPQRDTTVAVLGQAEFDVQLEIPELLLGHDVLTTARRGQRAIFYRPTDRFLAVPRHPAGHILAVEQFNWLSFSPSPVIHFLDHWRAYADPFEQRLVRPFHFENPL